MRHHPAEIGGKRRRSECLIVNFFVLEEIFLVRVPSVETEFIIFYYLF